MWLIIVISYLNWVSLGQSTLLETAEGGARAAGLGYEGGGEVELESHDVEGSYRGAWSRDLWPQDLENFLPSSGFATFVLRSLAVSQSAVCGEVTLREHDGALGGGLTLEFEGLLRLEEGHILGVARSKDNGASSLSHLDLLGRRAAGAGDDGMAYRFGAHISKDSSSRASVALAAAFGYEIDNYDKKSMLTCEFMIDWILRPAEFTEGVYTSMKAEGTIMSQACGVALTIRANSMPGEVQRMKAARYTAATTALALAQVALLIRQMEVTTTPVAAARVSLLMLGQQALVDAYLCLLHLTLGILYEPLFNSFATIAFFLFVIFAVFEMRYMLVCWKARRVADSWTAQRQLALIHARFYGALLAGALLSWISKPLLAPLTFVMYSFWLPQVMYSAKCDAPQPLLPLYVVGTSIARLVVPVYLFVMPGNQLQPAPSPAIAAALALWVGLQAAILLSQRAWGPRWFVPPGVLPPRYNYKRLTLEKKGECVICMSLVEASKDCMVTPCGHVFHKHCLDQWMIVKLECPTCRRSLPPP